MGTKFLHLYRELGIIDLFFYSLDKSLSRLSNNKFRLYKYLLVSQAVKAKPILAPHRASNISIRHISQYEAKEISFPRPREVIDARYQQNAHCLGAFVNHELIGFIWLNFDTYIEDEVRCTFSLQPAAMLAWDYDVYVVPHYRNGLTFVKLWDAANQFMHENNIQYTLSRISAFNRQSVASHNRMGAKKLGTSIFVCVGEIQLLLASVAPYIHVSTNDRLYPTIVLDA